MTKLNNKKKILRIGDGKFVLGIYEDRIETCNHAKYAMDLRSLSWEALSNTMSYLHEQGFSEAKVMEI